MIKNFWNASSVQPVESCKKQNPENNPVISESLSDRKNESVGQFVRLKHDAPSCLMLGVTHLHTHQFVEIHVSPVRQTFFCHRRVNEKYRNTFVFLRNTSSLRIIHSSLAIANDYILTMQIIFIDYQYNYIYPLENL
jgi:hypothetical protein